MKRHSWGAFGVNSHHNHHHTFHLKWVFLAVLACALIARAAACVYETYRGTMTSVTEYYAVLEVTDILTHYIETHSETLPRDWEDLQEDYDYVDRGYNSFTFSELREIVRIDFDELAKQFGVCRQDAYNHDGGRIIQLRKSGDAEIIESQANERLFAIHKKQSPGQHREDSSSPARGDR